MAYFADLSPCTYFSNLTSELVAVGWLERHQPFQQAAVEEGFYLRLIELTRNPWQPVHFMGMHRCDLCQFDGPSFSANLFVPHGGRIYVAPCALTHFVATHWYCPPQMFIEAVLACPPMRSMEYKKALLANGGRELVRNC